MIPRSPVPPLVAAAAFAVLAARAAGAQGGAPAPECAAAPVPPSAGLISNPALVAQDACQKAADLFLLLAPQLGTVVAGGNPDPGQGGTVGGIGHFGLSVRVNALRAPVPRFESTSLSVAGARASTVRTAGTWLAFPEADLAVGLFRGVPVGLSRVGGVDLLVNAAYVPTITRDEVAVRTNGSAVRVGVGARVGLLQESALVPGVALAVVRRSTPTAAVDARAGGDTVGVRGFRVRTDSWRLTAAKGLVFVRVAAGVGQDRVDARARLNAVLNQGGSRLEYVGTGFSRAFTRTNYFGNVTLGRLPFAALVGEIGRTSGGSLPATFNNFDGRRPDAAYSYGSVSVRLGF